MRPIAAKESVLRNYRCYISPVFFHRPSHCNSHNFGEGTAERKEISLNRQKEGGDSYLVVTPVRSGEPSIDDLVKSVGFLLDLRQREDSPISSLAYTSPLSMIRWWMASLLR